MNSGPVSDYSRRLCLYLLHHFPAYGYQFRQYIVKLRFGLPADPFFSGQQVIKADIEIITYEDQQLVD